jgi:hypothetical protein
MLETIDELLSGNRDVVTHYVAAKDKWSELFTDMKDFPVSAWARWLSDNQLPFFEKDRTIRGLGQEILAWTGFGVLYNEQKGFGDNRWLGHKLIKAFAESGCSSEVKFRVRQAAIVYHLDEDEEVESHLQRL